MERKLLTSLKAWKECKKRKPLIIRGVRQVGKTYLLQRFGSQSFPNYHYFNFEENNELSLSFDRNLDPSRILTELQFHSKQPIHSSTDLIIFDEIQECPRALTSLKYFQEKMPEQAICCAGSLLGIHLNSGSFPVGKVEVIDMHPMTFFEFLAVLKEKKALDFLQQWELHTEIPITLHRNLWDQLKWYFIIGGLPESIQTFLDHIDNKLIAFKEVRKKQEQLIIAYLADIAKHSGKTNSMHIERILHAIPNQLSNSQDGIAKRFQFKGVIPKIDKYNRLANAIDWLDTAHMIIKVHITNRGEIPFAAFAKESWFKLFLFDIGILGAMSNLPPRSILDYDYGTYKGYFAENFVAQELLAAGYRSLFSWEENRSEIEFLIEMDGMPIPIEVKSGWITKAQSLSKFRSKYAPRTSIVLSANEAKIGKNVLRIPLYLASKIADLNLETLERQ